MGSSSEPSDLLGRPAEALRVWFVHDWLTGIRGGEKVLLRLTRLFPNSRIATLFYVPGSVSEELEGRIGRVSFLQRVPGVARHYRNLLPLMPWAIKSLKLDGGCDVVISTSHCVAKGIAPPPGVPHVSYCFTPMRYVWEMQGHYFSGFSPKKVAAGVMAPWLRRVDLGHNAGVTEFVGSCRNVCDRIERCYKRPARVAYPGVDEIYLDPTPTSPPPGGPYYLMVSALVPYKRVDLAVEAFAGEWGRGRRLVILGKGPEEGRLRVMAG